MFQNNLLIDKEDGTSEETLRSRGCLLTEFLL